RGGLRFRPQGRARVCRGRTDLPAALPRPVLASWSESPSYWNAIGSISQVLLESNRKEFGEFGESGDSREVWKGRAPGRSSEELSRFETLRQPNRPGWATVAFAAVPATFQWALRSARARPERILQRPLPTTLLLPGTAGLGMVINR